MRTWPPLPTPAYRAAEGRPGLGVETVIDLLRHGETVGGQRLRGARTDDPLTARGWHQLEMATGDGSAWDVIASSPLRRCHDFAGALAERAGCPCRVDAQWREYDFGAWDGQPFDALWREQGIALAAFFGDPDACTPPGGEDAAAFRERVRAAWGRLLADCAGRRVLLLGHGGVLRQLVADVLGASGNVHPALEWPHAAASRIRVVAEAAEPPAAALVFHGRPPELGPPTR